MTKCAPRHVSEYSPLTYPGEIPRGSFAIRRGYVEPIRSTADGMAFADGQQVGPWLVGDGLAELADLYVPMLAYGSNACPGRLVEKFARSFPVGSELDRIVAVGATVIGAQRAWVCSHTDRGVLPVTIAAAPDRELECHVLLLPARLIPKMDRSEGRATGHYAAVRLTGTEARLDGGQIWRQPLSYLGCATRAPLVIDEQVQFFDDLPLAAAELALTRYVGGRETEHLLAHEEIETDVALIDIVDRVGLDRPVFDLFGEV